MKPASRAASECGGGTTTTTTTMASPQQIVQTTNSGCMKGSLSMTSLPPPTQRPPMRTSNTDEGSTAELTQMNRLSVDRPYNSLKKKRDLEIEVWRRSWGSGHSHSSCSLQSNTTNTGSGTGKDEFWAALQTNYNYIMDTKLIESCKEARGEIEGSIVPDLTDETDCCKKLTFQTSRSHGSGLGDPRRLRRWLRECEARFARVPSISEGRKLRSAELKRLLNEHSELYREIVSQARTVAASIRATETEKQTEEGENSSSASPASGAGSGNKRGDESTAKGLERRYHLLYLKAIEVQCMLENLLERRQSPESASSSTSTDEEPAPKLARIGSEKLTYRGRDYVDDGNVTDDDWIALRRAGVLTDLSSTADAFEADSEGSDNENVPKITISGSTTSYSSKSDGPPTIMSPNKGDEASIMSDHKAFDDTIDVVSVSPPQSGVTNTATVTSPQIESPKVVTVKKRPPKKSDASKFNRSNRKSKNCAIFYFKHVSDNEANNAKETTDDDELLVDNTSEDDEDEEWIFTAQDDEDNHDDDEEEQSADGTFKRRLNFTPDGVIETTTETHSNLMEVATSTATGAITETNTVQESGHSSKISYICVTKATKESIQKLVLGAESLVRDEVILRAQGLQSVASKMSYATPTIHRGDGLMQSPKIKRVREWLEDQPLNAATSSVPPFPPLATDCEASGENSDSDSLNHDSDTSAGVTDSQATFMHRNGSQATSTEGLGGSADILGSTKEETASSTSKSQTIELRMNNVRTANRPWSVSCISQLEAAAKAHASSNQDSNFSISESALDTLSLPNLCNKSDQSSPAHKRTLRKRRLRNRRRSARKEPKIDLRLMREMVKSQSFSGQIEIKEDILATRIEISPAKETDEESMFKPDFKIGSVTKVYAQTLGPLAGLANFNQMHKDTVAPSPTDFQRSGTEELSSYEQVWDNYQEKYLSEPYSEDRDMEAAKRLLEFGDDYRAFLDSQSDACSSLSAAHLDSVSPPRPRRHLGGGGARTPSDVADSSLELRKRRLWELSEFERRRKNLGKADGDDRHKSTELKPTDDLPSHLSSKPDGGHSEKTRKNSGDSTTRRHRQQKRKSGSSSSSLSDSDNDLEICNLLSQSRSRLENVEALRVRHHLLRPEDYAEIVATCQENILCLETVLRGAPSNLLSIVRAQQARDLLSIWESLLDWSENTQVIRQLQDEIDVLKHSLTRLGTQAFTFDSEESVEGAIQDLEQERTRLQYYRSKMLKINASVQRWITHQENRLWTERERGETDKEPSLADDRTFHQQLKNDVTDMYAVWDQTDDRLKTMLENLELSLRTWRQFECGLSELKETLDKDRGAILGFKGALEAGSANPSEFVSNAETVANLLRDNTDSDIKSLLEDGILPPEILQYGMRPSSTSCSSDSGISDDGGALSERERRLGYLRRLAKQLENALAGSDALKTITDRMRAAEAELSTLQETCRDLILKTTVSHNQFLESMNLNTRQPINVQIPIIAIKGKGGNKLKKKPKKRSPTNTLTTGAITDVPDAGDSDEPNSDDESSGGWWRFLRYAVPLQLALLALFFATYGLEPSSCDAMNNFQNSFNPQLRYVRGPPPI